MQFNNIFAVILSMAAVALALPVDSAPEARDVETRDPQGLCVPRNIC